MHIQNQSQGKASISLPTIAGAPPHSIHSLLERNSFSTSSSDTSLVLPKLWEVSVLIRLKRARLRGVNYSLTSPHHSTSPYQA